MIKRSKISWCDYSSGDANFIIRGTEENDCETSSGCTNCYARKILLRNPKQPKTTKMYPEKLRHLVRTTFLDDDVPYRRGKGSKPLVFCGDMGDWLHPSVTETFKNSIVELLGNRTDVDWLLLTKRPQFVPKINDWPSNVWFGITIECNKYIERLEYAPQNASVIFVSNEPCLEEITYDNLVYAKDMGVSWWIQGAESGANRRPFDTEWARRTQRYCKELGIKYFFKQGSAFKPGQFDNVDGIEYKEFPESVSFIVWKPKKEFPEQW